MVTRIGRPIWLAGFVALVAFVAAGCGGSKSPRVASLAPTTGPSPASGATETASGTGGKGLAVEFATCIRSHGVPSFPDPGGPIPPGLKQNPAFVSAMQRCSKLLPSGATSGSGLTIPQRSILLAQAACIRAHGVPDFPDPTFPRHGGVLYPAVPGFDPGSPASQRAAAACGVTGHPHGG